MRRFIISLLLVSVSIPPISPQTPVRDYELFVPYTNTVPLTVNNITQFSAQLQWNLPVETRERLKAMRVNCTTLKSLIEPYEIQPPKINLYNPSVLGSRITIHDLQPATKYSCRLVGAMSLDVGREKLAILSEVAKFSTLLEAGGGPGSGSDANATSVIVGGTVPTIIIILACISILVGFHFYRKSKRPGGDKSKKYRMHISKDGSGPEPGPSAGKSGEKSSKHGTKKSKKDKSDKSNKDHSSGAKRDRSEHRKAKREKSQQRKDRKSYEKLDGEGKSKKASKKKSLDLYGYSELVVHSSEEDLYGYKDDGNMELEADLGWDPTTYYPLPRRMQSSNPIQVNRPIQLKDLSSPAVLGHDGYEEEEEELHSPNKYAKGHYQPYSPHHTIQPLY